MPVTIGALTNVPAPGDQIRSPWTQDVSKLAVHVFASKAALDAQWGTAPDGAHAYTIDTGSAWIRVGSTWQKANGQIGYKEVTANITNIGPTQVTFPLDVTVTLAAGRRLKLTAGFRNLTSTVVGDVFIVRLVEGVSILNEIQTLTLSAGAAHGHGITIARVISPGAGTHTYNVTSARAAGSGTGAVTTGATSPAYLLVEDIT